MLKIKKALPDETNKVRYAIMTLMRVMGDISDERMKELIDRCYYYYDDETDDIVAIVAARRVVLTYEAPDESGVDFDTHPHQYLVSYLGFNAEVIRNQYKDPRFIVMHLVREVTADMNDWSVVIDVQEQIHMNSLANSVDDATEIIDQALRANSFKPAEGRRGWYRLSPINFEAIR